MFLNMCIMDARDGRTPHNHNCMRVDHTGRVDGHYTRVRDRVCVCVAQTRREMSVAGSDERMLSDHQVKSAEI